MEAARKTQNHCPISEEFFRQYVDGGLSYERSTVFRRHTGHCSACKVKVDHLLDVRHKHDIAAGKTAENRMSHKVVAMLIAVFVVLIALYSYFSGNTPH